MPSFFDVPDVKDSKSTILGQLSNDFLVFRMIATKDHISDIIA